MRTAQINEYGPPSVIKIADVTKPTPSDDQVLLEVHGASLNPFDAVVLAGYLKDMIPLNLPATLGGDVAGVVTMLGGKVTNLAVGDKVYGQAATVAGNSGSLAEYAVTASGQISKAPNNVNPTEAASLALVGVSALQALMTHIHLKQGQKIFINGGAGNIGRIAIQIAKHVGAHVATTATGDGVAYVKDLGADEVIDYKSQDFSSVLGNYDAALDTAGGDDFDKALGILKTGGIAVSLKGKADKDKADALGVTGISQQTHVTTENLEKLTQLIEAGVVTPRIGKTFPLDETKQAFEALESGKVKGKIAISVN